MPSAEKDAPFHVDPERRHLHEATGFYVRAKDGERWGSADIAELNTDSLYRFLRSRGGDNPWAESIVLALLGHDRTVIPPGRPLGAASGGDPGFWDRLGIEDGGLPTHLPMGVNIAGQGPENDADAHHYVCWCGDTECPLTLALGHAWRVGFSFARRVTGDADA